jgi:hypothetical protein
VNDPAAGNVNVPPIAVLLGFTRILLFGTVHDEPLQPGPLKMTNELFASKPLPKRMKVVADV